MESLFSSGQIVDLIVAFMVVEAVGLVLLRKATGRGLSPIGIFWLLLPGLFLLLALRGALASWPWQGIAGTLACALLAHLVDLWRRTRDA